MAQAAESSCGVCPQPAKADGASLAQALQSSSQSQIDIRRTTGNHRAGEVVNQLSPAASQTSLRKAKTVLVFIHRLRGRDASYLAPPAQIRTCGFPAYGSHLGYRRQFGAVDEPTSCVTLTRLGVRRVLSWRAFPSVPALRSTNSAADPSALFVGFPATMAGSDFSCPYIIGYGSSPSRCGPSAHATSDGQTRDLPASDAIPLHVMWP